MTRVFLINQIYVRSYQKHIKTTVHRKNDFQAMKNNTDDKSQLDWGIAICKNSTNSENDLCIRFTIQKRAKNQKAQK